MSWPVSHRFIEGDAYDKANRRDCCLHDDCWLLCKFGVLSFHGANRS
jgi:hypothetical protein